MKRQTKYQIWAYIIGVAIPLAVGGLAAFFTREQMDIYGEIRMPPLSPPSVLFPIVWGILYFLMGIGSAAVWLYRYNDLESAKTGLTYYGASLLFNFVWNFIFFYFRNFLVAFVWLLVLLFFIIRTISAYKRVAPIAAYLQIPYAIWVAFAGYLTFGIWWLNR